MDLNGVNMCLGNRKHEPHNVQVTFTHICAGISECGKRHAYNNHNISKVTLVPCDGMPDAPA